MPDRPRDRCGEKVTRRFPRSVRSELPQPCLLEQANEFFAGAAALREMACPGRVDASCADQSHEPGMLANRAFRARSQAQRDHVRTLDAIPCGKPDARDRSIAAQREQAPVKTLVGIRPGIGIVSTQRVRHVADGCSEGDELNRRGPAFSEQLDSMDLERGQEIVSAAQLIQPDGQNPDFLARPHLDEAFVAQPQECLADRRAAHAELAGDVEIGNRGPGGDLVGDNSALEGRIGDVAERGGGPVFQA